MSNAVDTLNRDQIEAFCKRWKVEKLALFGSILRDDFSLTSDVDFLVKFSVEANYGLLEQIKVQEELAQLIGRPVDLITYSLLDTSNNWIKKKHILETSKPYYVA